ncbi:hypothetical protein JCGZ_03673 [Jatropha curcas]|uniref:Uncharacterized protein n=1 Tax=Jatropha curcas TaxID=180498 RepID=A0A067KT45_JATCU|nr:hypothetical protein JCGZ_03673 [Jatropha curcas]
MKSEETSLKLGLIGSKGVSLMTKSSKLGLIGLKGFDLATYSARFDRLERQEQKAKARILQSILAAEDAEEAERKAEKLIAHGEAEKEATPKEDEGDADPDQMKTITGWPEKLFTRRRAISVCERTLPFVRKILEHHTFLCID